MKGISVLLIEDNRDDEWLTLRTLRKLGVDDVKVARDGLSALSMLLGSRQNDAPERYLPDLILLDLRLPKIDGLDVLRKICTEGAMDGARVLVLTSSEDPHDIEVCKKLGVMAFSSKPLDEKTLLALPCRWPVQGSKAPL